MVVVQHGYRLWVASACFSIHGQRFPAAFCVALTFVSQGLDKHLRSLPDTLFNSAASGERRVNHIMDRVTLNFPDSCKSSTFWPNLRPWLS